MKIPQLFSTVQKYIITSNSLKPKHTTHMPRHTPAASLEETASQIEPRSHEGTP